MGPYRWARTGSIAATGVGADATRPRCARADCGSIADFWASIPLGTTRMHRLRRLRVPLRLLAPALLLGCAATERTTTPVAADPTPPPLAFETFDAVWSTVNEQHFDRDFNGVDWAAVRDELRPRVDEVRSDDELRALLDEMLGRLALSHFAIIPGEIADASASTDEWSEEDAAGGATGAPSAAGDLGVRFRLVEGRVVAVAPDAGGPAARAGVRSGWELVAVDGRPLAPLPADALEAEGLARYEIESRAAMRGALPVGATRTYAFRDESGVERAVELTAVPLGGQVVRFGNLPPFETRVLERRLESADFAAAGVDGADASIGLISFNVWMVPAARAIDAAIDRHRDADGIVIDLRGNPGGLGGMAMGVGGHFFTEPISLGTMTTRTGEIEFRVNPRRVTADGRIVEPFRGRVAILLDPLSASTTEIFAAGLQEPGRARVFGQPSAGAALPSVATRLPNGDVLLYAMADFQTPGGTRIEGRGVLPDEPIQLTRDLLLREGDPVLAAALRWLLLEADSAAAATP